MTVFFTSFFVLVISQNIYKETDCRSDRLNIDDIWIDSELESAPLIQVSTGFPACPVVLKYPFRHTAAISIVLEHNEYTSSV